MDKRGSEKYYIIISLILGLLILGISLYWIFQEYFSEDDIDWEVCRQSILLRATLPDEDLVALEVSTKGAFPLKCKTEVVEINDLSTPDKVYKRIADAVAEGWYMFGEGEWDFVASEVWSSQTVCMVFARIHFDEEEVGEFDEESFGDWMDYFIEKKYGVDPFTEGFQDFYHSSKPSGSSKTYDGYLPLRLVSEVPKGGSFVVNWDDVSFYPGRDGDYLLVYMLNKESGFKGDEWFLSENWKKTKVIALTSSNSLDSIKCDKFLTIPA